jgi:hypothetical protein
MATKAIFVGINIISTWTPQFQTHSGNSRIREEGEILLHETSVQRKHLCCSLNVSSLAFSRAERMAPLCVPSPLAKTVISRDLGSRRRRVDSLDTV